MGVVETPMGLPLPAGEALLLPPAVMRAVILLSEAVAIKLMSNAEAMARLKEFAAGHAAQMCLFKNIGVEVPVEHAEPCQICGAVYDRRDFNQVLLHNSQGEDGRHLPVPVLEGIGGGVQVGPCRWCQSWKACEALGVGNDDCCRHDPPKFVLDPEAEQAELAKGDGEIGGGPYA
jgi:hypothetical protein